MNTFLLEVLFAQESTGFTYDYYLNNHMNQIGMRNFMLCMFLVIAAVILVVYAVSRLISANDARRNADALNVLKSNEVAVKDKEVAIKASSQDWMPSWHSRKILKCMQALWNLRLVMEIRKN